MKQQPILKGFQLIAEAIKLDAKKRISIAKAASKDTSLYNEYVNEDGTIMLVPVETIPTREAWLYKNDKALKSVLKGIKETTEGKTKNLGSFAKHAE